MSALPRWLVSVGLAFVLLSGASSARASQPSHELPFDGGWTPLALAPGSSADEAVVIGPRSRAVAGGDVSNALAAVVWSFVAGRVVRDAVIAEMERPESVRAVRAGDRLFVLTAPMDGEGVRLFELDDTLRVVRHVEVGDGAKASLVVTDAYVVVSAFVNQPPVVSDWKSDKVAPPSSALHVRVLRRSDLSLAGARIFRGEMLLYPHNFASVQTITALADRVFVTIPENYRCTIARLRLPSLAVEAQRTFATLELDGNMILSSENGRIVAERGEWIELTPALDLRRRTHHPRWGQPFGQLERTTDTLRVGGHVVAVGAREPDGRAAITWKGH